MNSASLPSRTSAAMLPRTAIRGAGLWWGGWTRQTNATSGCRSTGSWGAANTAGIGVSLSAATRTVELRTEARDPSLVSDPTHIIYDAMLESPDVYYVSNGDHTHTIRDAFERGARLEDALSVREREEDPPNFTPRIASVLDLRGQGELAFAMLRANAADTQLTDRIYWRFPFAARAVSATASRPIGTTATHCRRSPAIRSGCPLQRVDARDRGSATGRPWIVQTPHRARGQGDRSGRFAHHPAPSWIDLRPITAPGACTICVTVRERCGDDDRDGSGDYHCHD